MFVLGTAGHVDHGKSTFVRLLTSQEPDRLPEEKRRGMTITLNFLWFVSQKFGKVGIVDVPGHKRFVKTMISGDSLIDGFLFLVAADDGWMPQSEEHLAVLRGLGVKRGIVFISKADLVDKDHLSEVEKEVREKLAAAGFSDVTIVTFSALDVNALSEIKLEVEKLLSSLPLPKNDRPARLWVDRVFQPKGQGVVVTGSLREGRLQEGAELVIYPSEKRAVVKSLQAYGKSVNRVESNSRLAIQLGKLSLSDVSRGCLLSTNVQLIPSRDIDVLFSPLSKEALKKDVEIRAHLGTRVQRAKLRTLIKWEDGRRLIRLKFMQKGMFRYLDRMVLRTSGDERTLGTAIVIDKEASLVKMTDVKKSFREEAASVSGNLDYLLKVHKAIVVDDYRRELAADVSPVLPPESFPGFWLEKGTSVEKLKNRLPHSVYEKLYEVSRPPQEKRDTTQQAKVLGILAGKLVPVDLTPMIKETGMRETITQLLGAKQIVRLPENHFLDVATFEKHIAVICRVIRVKDFATTSELKEAIGLSRKYAVMILEKADEVRITYLKEGVRRLLKGA